MSTGKRFGAASAMVDRETPVELAFDQVAKA